MVQTMSIGYACVSVCVRITNNNTSWEQAEGKNTASDWEKKKNNNVCLFHCLYSPSNTLVQLKIVIKKTIPNIHQQLSCNKNTSDYIVSHSFFFFFAYFGFLFLFFHLELGNFFLCRMLSSFVLRQKFFVIWKLCLCLCFWWCMCVWSSF